MKNENWWETSPIIQEALQDITLSLQKNYPGVELVPKLRWGAGKTVILEIEDIPYLLGSFGPESSTGLSYNLTTAHEIYGRVGYWLTLEQLTKLSKEVRRMDRLRWELKP